MTDLRSFRGEGWTVLEKDGRVVVKFDHKPDGDTLRSLKRASFTYDSDTRSWWVWATLGRYEKALDIAMHAVTWESVGEDPPSWLDEADYPIFHKY